MTMLRTTCFSLILLLSGGAAMATPSNMIVNGDFEIGPTGPGLVNDNNFGDLSGESGKRSWDVWQYDGGILGWHSTEQTAGLEVQTTRTVGGADPASGGHYVELDSHPNKTSGETRTGIWQPLDLGVGKYVLSYWYQPRTNKAGDNKMQVLWDNTELALHDERSSTHPGWVQYQHMLHVAAENTFKLTFRSPLDGGKNTLGAFLDDVQLHQAPEPSTLALVGLAGAGLYWRRRRTG